VTEQTTNQPLKYFVGNQVDLEDAREVSVEMGEGCAEQFHGKYGMYFETSAKTGFGIEALFKDICTELVKRTPQRMEPAHALVVERPAGASATPDVSSCC
jgi:GTPase SAR1 family protein